AKLGIFNEELEDEALIRDLLIIMYQHSEDYTNTFRELTIDNIEDTKMFKTEEFKKWYKIWQERLTRQPESKDASKQLMQSSNPVVIPRNHVGEKNEVAFVSAICKTANSKEGNYKSIGFDICLDSAKCNERIVSVEKLEKILKDVNNIK
ncbi:protein adenylyltransferase SelO family protein, partial [Clostridium perfringens]|uniref:protein adenylyltransferase SelO family protein n=1 Tax=Clostridium perfringens TaxID=1502 RepID=UPI002ACF017F